MTEEEKGEVYLRHMQRALDETGDSRGRHVTAFIGHALMQALDEDTPSSILMTAPFPIPTFMGRGMSEQLREDWVGPFESEDGE